MSETTQAEARPKPRGFNERTGRCRHSMREPFCHDCWPPPPPPVMPVRCGRCGSLQHDPEHTPEMCDKGAALLDVIAEAARDRPPVAVPKRALTLREPGPGPRARLMGATPAAKPVAKPAVAPAASSTVSKLATAFGKPAAEVAAAAARHGLLPVADERPPTNGERTATASAPRRSAAELLELHHAGRLRGTNGEALDAGAVKLLEHAAKVETAPPPPEAPSDWQERCQPTVDVGPPADRRGPKKPHLPLCPYCAALPPTAVLVQFCNHDKNRAKARLRGRKVEFSDAAVLAELRRCVNRDLPADGEPIDPVEMSKRSIAIRLTPDTVKHLDRLIGTGLGANREAVVEQLLTFALSALVFTGASMGRSVQ